MTTTKQLDPCASRSIQINGIDSTTLNQRAPMQIVLQDSIAINAPFSQVNAHTDVATSSITYQYTSYAAPIFEFGHSSHTVIEGRCSNRISANQFSGCNIVRITAPGDLTYKILGSIDRNAKYNDDAVMTINGNMQISGVSNLSLTQDVQATGIYDGVFTANSKPSLDITISDLPQLSPPIHTATITKIAATHFTGSNLQLNAAGNTQVYTSGAKIPVKEVSYKGIDTIETLHHIPTNYTAVPYTRNEISMFLGSGMNFISDAGGMLHSMSPDKLNCNIQLSGNGCVDSSLSSFFSVGYNCLAQVICYTAMRLPLVVDIRTTSGSSLDNVSFNVAQATNIPIPGPITLTASTVTITGSHDAAISSLAGCIDEPAITW